MFSRRLPFSISNPGPHTANTTRRGVFRQHLARFSLLLGLSISAITAFAETTASLGDFSGPTFAALDGQPVRLAKLVVSDTHAVGAPPSAEVANKTLSEIAGATSVIDSDSVERSRVASVADLLAFQPGVYAQTAQGSDGIKISIRGSGINRGTGFFRSGTQFYFDGLPLTGAGGTPYELFEPLGLAYTEVLRGGNAFDFGSVALGGAINYITQTGYDAAPLALRLEAGSFGYYKGQVSSGQVLGAFDYFASVTASERDGFQEHSASKSFGFAGNVGYRLSPKITTRFYLRHRRTDNETPGNLRQKDIDADPRQANSQNVQQNATRLQPGSTWIANKTTFELPDDATLVAGLVYHDYPIRINPRPAPGNILLPANGADGPGTLALNARLTDSTWWYSDVAASVLYTRTDELFKRPSTTSVSFATTFHPAAGVRVFENNPNVTTGPTAFGTLLKRVNYDGSSDSVLRFSNDTEVAPKLWLTAGAAWVSIRRNSEFEYVAPSVTLPPDYRQSFSRTRDHFVPRIGVRYEISPEWLVFGNITRSVEPPNSWSPSSGSGFATVNNLSNGYLIADLKDQTATSYEIGTRLTKGIFSGSLSLYHSDVKNELLTVQVDPGPPPVTRELNGSPTEKEGIEAGLDVVLWSGDHATDPSKAKDRLVLRQAYTLNAFHYKHDAAYGKNQLPGIPREFYQAELLLDHASGFYFGPSLQSASGTYVDYANTFKVHGYTIYGLKLGYDAPNGRWQAYLDLRNLTDKHHTVSVSPVFDTRENPAAPANTPAGQPNDLRLLSPGDGFGVFAGVSLRF